MAGIPMWVSFVSPDVVHHFHVEPAEAPSHDETDYKLGVAHAS